MRNLAYKIEFCMQFYFHANQNHFRKNGFALTLAVKQRLKGTRKWPIGSTLTTNRVTLFMERLECLSNHI